MLSEAFFTKGFRLEGHRTSCCFDYISRDFKTRFWLIFMMVIGYFIPNLVIITSYICLYRKVKHRQLDDNNTKTVDLRLNVASRVSQKVADNLNKKEWSLAKKIITQIVLFNMAWFPYVCLILIAQYGDEKNIHLYVTPFVVFILNFFSKLFVLFINIFYAYWNLRSSMKKEQRLLNARQRTCLSNTLARNESSRVSRNSLVSKIVKY